MKKVGKQKCNENAANRYSYIGEIYDVGANLTKEKVLKSLPIKWRNLHKKGYIHIHDLDAYEFTYNCLTFDILKDFPYERFKDMDQQRKILCTFEYIKRLFTDIGNEQSGGMAIANFDNEIATILANLQVSFNTENKRTIANAIYNLIIWCTKTHTRMGKTSYYVSLNIGLAENEFARFIAYTLIDEFEKASDLVFKPNIIFKVKKGVNCFENDKNYDLLKKSLLCTAKKMIPTYVLCDSSPNKTINPKKLAIMGCRTRVVDNLFGEKSSIGRGNIANISINLPRLALEVESKFGNLTFNEKRKKFVERWNQIAKMTKDILLDRFNKVCKCSLEEFPINKRHNLWVEDFGTDLKKVFRNGTLSLGFIGLSEAFEILSKKRYYKNKEVYDVALDFVKHMRNYCDNLIKRYNLNFSLLATSGELISGRFVDIDRKEFKTSVPIFEKGFYSNSFHINVDSNLSGFEKIKIEGSFHNFCNGGCITYVELGEAPIGNYEGLLEYVEYAIKSGVHYLGFNFPKDVCDKCGVSGIFDVCPHCGSKKITRIRRVSGYLEVLDGFTQGKKNEEKTRRPN